MSVPAPVGAARPRLSRRSALLALGSLGALTVATGCTSDDPTGSRRDRTGSEPGPGQDPNVAVATEALAAQRRMRAMLAAVVASHPALGERLRAVSSAHDAHIAVLDGAVPPPSPTPASRGARAEDSDDPSPGPGAGASTSPSPPAVPRRPGQALSRVAVEERALALTLKQLAFRAPSGTLARLLGSMAASSAQHSVALTPQTSTGTSTGTPGALP